MNENDSILNVRQEAKKFISHSIVMIPFRAYSMGLQFAISVFLARVLTAAGYGKWGLILALSQWGYTFFLLWSSTAITRYGREEFIESGGIHKSFTARLFLYLPGFVAMLLVTGFGAGIITDYIQSSYAVLLLIVFYAVGFSLSDTVQYVFPAIGRPDLSSAIMALEKTAALGLLSIFYKLDMMNPAAPLISFLAASWLINIPVVIIYRKLLFPLKKDPDIIKRYWNLSKPILVSAPLGGLFGWVELFFINHFSTINDVGRFFLAFQFTNIITQLSFIITMASFSFTTLIVVYKRKDLENVFANEVQYTAALLGSTLVMLITPIVWTVFYYVNQEKAGLLREIWVTLIPGCIISFTVATLGSFYFAKEDQLSLTIISIIQTVIQIALDILLIPIIGASGAGIALSASTLMRYYFLCRRLNKFEIHCRFTLIIILFSFVPAAVVMYSQRFNLLFAETVVFCVGLLFGLFSIIFISGLFKRKYIG